MDKGKALEYGRPAELLENDAGAFTGAAYTAIHSYDKVYFTSRTWRVGTVVAAHSFGFERQLRSALHEAALSSFDGADVADVADVSLWISVGNNCLFASC